MNESLGEDGKAVDTSRRNKVAIVGLGTLAVLILVAVAAITVIDVWSTSKENGLFMLVFWLLCAAGAVGAAAFSIYDRSRP